MTTNKTNESQIPLFICIEGLDYSGKDTLANILSFALKRVFTGQAHPQPIDVYLVKTPSDKTLEILLSKLGQKPGHYLNILQMDFVNQLPKIKNTLLNKGIVIISDYIPYFTAHRGCDLENFSQEMYNFICANTPTPTHSFNVEIDFEEQKKFFRKGRKLDTHDNQKTIRGDYNHLDEQVYHKLFNNGQNLVDLFAQIVDTVFENDFEKRKSLKSAALPLLEAYTSDMIRLIEAKKTQAQPKPKQGQKAKKRPAKKKAAVGKKQQKKTRTRKPKSKSKSPQEDVSTEELTYSDL